MCYTIRSFVQPIDDKNTLRFLSLLSFLSFYGWQKDLLAGIFFCRLGLGTKGVLLWPTTGKLPVPGRVNGVSWDPKVWLSSGKSEFLDGQLGLEPKGVLLRPTTGKSPVPGRSIVSFETQKPASAPTFLSILGQQNPETQPVLEQYSIRNGE